MHQWNSQCEILPTVNHHALAFMALRGCWYFCACGCGLGTYSSHKTHHISVHRMLRVLLLLLLLLLLCHVFTSSQSQICLAVRFGFVHGFICFITGWWELSILTSPCYRNPLSKHTKVWWNWQNLAKYMLFFNLFDKLWLNLTKYGQTCCNIHN